MTPRWYLVRAFVVAKPFDLSLDWSVGCERAWISLGCIAIGVKGHNVGQMFGTRAPRVAGTRLRSLHTAFLCGVSIFFLIVSQGNPRCPFSVTSSHNIKVSIERDLE